MPLAGKETATEIQTICTQQTCSKLNKWFNKLYLFRQEYLIYQDNI